MSEANGKLHPVNQKLKRLTPNRQAHGGYLIGIRDREDCNSQYND
jgi:hypothetical protein